MIFTPVILAVLTTAAELLTALQDGLIGTEFDLTATVLSECRADDRDFAVEDTTGSVIISPPRNETNLCLTVGTVIRARGKISKTRYNHPFANCKSVVRHGFTLLPPPPEITFEQIHSGKFDARLVRTSGILRDYFTDEIDPNYVFLILNQGRESLYAVIKHPTDSGLRLLDGQVGQQLDIIGLCDPRSSGCRRKIGRIIRMRGLPAARQSPTTGSKPTDLPLLDNIDKIQATDLPKLGRCRVLGRVLAVWQGRSLLLHTPANTIARINLAKDNPPHVGDCIEAIGFPETDLYRINFSRAIWRTVNLLPDSPDSIKDVSARDIMTNHEGNLAIRAGFHGRTVRLRGTVRSLPSVGNDGRFYLESVGYTLPVDISANPVLAEKLEIGSVIDVTGVCVMDIENWRPNLVFPHIKEVMIVTRTPEDIVVVKHPPWWTPARLMIVIGSLLAVLIGILIWNRALKALAEKRGKALANEELERLESDLKVCERTRLAVELHDSIAQNLTGVSMEIDTALRGEEPLPESAAQHMGRALRTIDSCRGELRNCLWDLRSQALEEEDMNKAIRLTLSQTIGKADLIVRFNVPRSRFTDNTAHTLLRIIRELAANAVRHGHATEIKVAGSIEDNILKFSVRDNGCGFDPDACPGVLDGHFGLQGVRERVASFEGSIRIESAPGKGTRVSVSINAPQGNDKEKL